MAFRQLSVFVILLVYSVSCASSKVADSYCSPYEDYLTPLAFGAKGDGTTDDTEALRKALYESDRQGKVLYFPSGYHFKATGTLNYFEGDYRSYTLNLMGCLPIKKGSYELKEFGGITVSKGVRLFHGAEISGSIERLCITGKRNSDVRFFDNCDCKGLVIDGCGVSCFEVMFYDTKVHRVSQITQNKFLSVCYFSKNECTSSGFTDSTLSFNYINGGKLRDDNSCFEWAYYNGAIVSNNFIDYYRTIYFPKATQQQTFVGPLSYSNQYQVFRYFYAAGSNNLKSITFSSVADSFNMNDPATMERPDIFKPLTYKGKDGLSYDMPPYVAICHSAWNVSIKDAKIERDMGPLVFIYSTLNEYENNRFEVSFIGNNKYKQGQIRYREGDPNPFYNGKYPQNKIIIKGIVEKLDELPPLSRGWTSSFNGRTVQVNNQHYQAENVYDGSKWTMQWKTVNNIEDD